MKVRPTHSTCGCQLRLFTGRPTLCAGQQTLSCTLSLHDRAEPAGVSLGLHRPVEADADDERPGDRQRVRLRRRQHVPRLTRWRSSAGGRAAQPGQSGSRSQPVDVHRGGLANQHRGARLMLVVSSGDSLSLSQPLLGSGTPQTNTSLAASARRVANGQSASYSRQRKAAAVEHWIMRWLLVIITVWKTCAVLRCGLCATCVTQQISYCRTGYRNNMIECLMHGI